jgi:hypothetical protein
MGKKKNIVLTKKNTKVEIKDSDGWMFDLKYLVNGRETYSCQIIKPDLAGRVERLEREGFKNSTAELKLKTLKNE